MLEAEVAETDGQFRVSGVRAGSENKGVDEPSIKINELNANEANFVLKTIYSIPRKIRLAILGILAVSAAILAITLISSNQENTSKKEFFDENAKDVRTSEYMSSVNYVLSTIPNNVISTRSADHWQRFSYSWNKHIDRIESAYRPIARGLSDDSMRKGENSDWVCTQLTNILSSHYEVYRGVSRINGISLSGSSSSANVLSTFCLLYTSPSPRDKRQSRMPSSA